MNNVWNDEQAAEIAKILKARANEIARYMTDSNINSENKLPESVEVALSREIKRLRDLAEITDQDED